MSTATVMSITDELVAELEKEAWLCDSDNTSMFMDPAVVAALLAERAELKRDAARYRWLREDARQDVDGYMSEVPVIVYANNYSDDWRNRIDAAIDAAMQAAQ